MIGENAAARDLRIRNIKSDPERILTHQHQRLVTLARIAEQIRNSRRIRAARRGIRGERPKHAGLSRVGGLETGNGELAGNVWLRWTKHAAVAHAELILRTISIEITNHLQLVFDVTMFCRIAPLHSMYIAPYLRVSLLGVYFLASHRI